jgi:uncharacterized membrane protein YagU involved in acid resistance
MEPIMKRILKGGLAGFLATAPMSVAMILMHQQLPRREQHSLPPGQITGAVTKRLGLKKHLGKREHEAATWVSHFGYGATAGALYGPLSRLLPGPPAVKGSLFGLLVWAGSYLSLLPATGLFPHAEKETSRRNGIMIVAHLVWGASLGWLTAAMTHERR